MWHMFNYGSNRRTWGSPNGAGENYASQFSLLSILGLKVRRPRGRPKGLVPGSRRWKAAQKKEARQ